MKHFALQLSAAAAENRQKSSGKRRGEWDSYSWNFEEADPDEGEADLSPAPGILLLISIDSNIAKSAARKKEQNTFGRNLRDSISSTQQT